MFPNIFDIYNVFLNLNKTEAAFNPYENEYSIEVGPIAGTATSNYVYSAFFNPSGSGITALIKRIRVVAWANGAGNYVNLSTRRITSASGGTLISASDIPKKNIGSSNPVLNIRHTGPSVSFSGSIDSRILGQPMAGAAGHFYSQRDIMFGSNDEPIVLQQGEGIAVYQEAGGTTAMIIRIYIEWEEISSGSTPTAQNEFLFAFPRVGNPGGTNYVYNSFFNPSGSGRTFIVKRIWFGSETCIAAAVYTNNLVLRRISSASSGTQVLATDLPKKHTGSSNSVADIRHTGVTVTTVGGSDARLGIVTPCGAAGEPHGFLQLNFNENDEKLILQQGEGIALMADTAGNANQLIRMIVEWQEVSSGSTPTAQNEYIWGSSRIQVAAVANQNFYTFFNPAGSGRVALIKRIIIRNDATSTATYQPFTFRRLTSATGGILISSGDIPKKHLGSATSSMEIRWCGSTCGTAITATYSGSADSRILTAIGPGTVAQTMGQNEILFSPNEKIVLNEGQGIGFYIEGTGDIDQYIKIMIEWQEVTSAPSPQNEYILNIGPISGSTTSGYVYTSIFNPAASGKTAIIKSMHLRIDAVAAASYIPMSIRRITSASAGTQITSANIIPKNTNSSSTVLDIRRTGVTVSYLQGANGRLVSVVTPGAVQSATAAGLTGYRYYNFINNEKLILRPGEGIALYQEAAGNANFRVQLLIEWQEVSSGATPTSLGEYLFNIGNITGTTSTNAYISFINPINSGKNYVIERIGMNINRTGTAVAPTYIPFSILKISTSTGGTTVSNSDIVKKNLSTGTSTALINLNPLSFTITQSSSSRVLGVTQPGAVNQTYGDFNTEVVNGDEIVLLPGEGLILYQEQNPGDVLFRVIMEINWFEKDIEFSQADFRFFNNNNSTNVGSPLANQNVSTTLSSSGQVFRLRILINVTTGTLSLGGQWFTLQFATKNGTVCGDDETFNNITTSTQIAFYDNSTPNDGNNLTVNANDPSNSYTKTNQTYEELNDFTNFVSLIRYNENGMWDFALIDNSAPSNTTYCLRIVKSNGALLNSYSFYPEITTALVTLTISCNTSVTSTSFGNIITGSVFTSSPNVSSTMSCSGTTLGCTLYVKDVGSGSNPGLYKSTSPTYLILSSDATLNGTSDGYGIQAATTTAGSGGILILNPKYNVSGNTVGGLTLSNTILASSTSDIVNRQIIITHKAAVSSNALSGSYSDTITYSCVVN
ncbi:MAG: hypothetical protein RMK17_02370 [bacterium]|nr:hypothetical protein [bacterium]